MSFDAMTKKLSWHLSKTGIFLFHNSCKNECEVD